MYGLYSEGVYFVILTTGWAYTCSLYLVRAKECFKHFVNKFPLSRKGAEKPPK